MKKFCVAVAAVSFFLIQTGCGGITDNKCSTASGNYSVKKTVTGVTCAKGGKSVKITNPKGVLPSDSSLSITQAASCDLIATEMVSSSLKIPYTGKSHDDDTIELGVESPDDLGLFLDLNIKGVGLTSCEFNGKIDWEGDINSNSIDGTINYDLAKHPDETKSDCPKTCTVTMDFHAITN
jgi:hypothetical protein